ncbi:hypothetical protein HK104_001595 [Borealophlyctis nickersoniae]|nr:hypothetical protein HK104_001595 [Borealophlyctis nickersoniae]
MSAFPPTDHIYNVLNGGMSGLGAMGGLEPGMVTFPDLDDFVSLMNTATGNGQTPIAPATAPVPPTTTQSEFDSIEALLFGANEIPQPQQQQQPTFQNPMIMSAAPIDFDFVFGETEQMVFGAPAASQAPQAQTTSAVSPAAVAAPPPVVPLSPPSSSDEKPVKAGRKRKLTPEEREEKAKERIIRNRAAAQESRDKKRKYMEDLEATNSTLEQHNAELSRRLETVEATNRGLVSRLEELASQLTSLRSQFQSATSPDHGRKSTIPAADVVKREDTDEPYDGTTTDVLSLGSILDIDTLMDDGLLASFVDFESDDTSNGDNAHPLAFIVASAILHSMISMFSKQKVATAPTINQTGTLGSGRRKAAEGGVAPPPRKGLGLLPDLNFYYSVTPPTRISNFPMLRKIIGEIRLEA